MKHFAPSEFRPQPIETEESVLGFCIALPFMFFCASYIIHELLTALCYGIGIACQIFQ